MFLPTTEILNYGLPLPAKCRRVFRYVQNAGVKSVGQTTVPQTNRDFPVPLGDQSFKLGTGHFIVMTAYENFPTRSTPK